MVLCEKNGTPAPKLSYDASELWIEFGLGSQSLIQFVEQVREQVTGEVRGEVAGEVTGEVARLLLVVQGCMKRIRDAGSIRIEERCVFISKVH